MGDSTFAVRKSLKTLDATVVTGDQVYILTNQAT